MARKICLDCNIRPIDRANGSDTELCRICYDYAGMENEHSDHGHDTLAETPVGVVPTGWYETYGWTPEKQLEDMAYERVVMVTCPVCHPELDMRGVPAKTGHHNTRAHSWTSHAGHDHPRTAADRAACRKANSKA